MIPTNTEPIKVDHKRDNLFLGAGMVLIVIAIVAGMLFG